MAEINAANMQVEMAQMQEQLRQSSLQSSLQQGQAAGSSAAIKLQTQQMSKENIALTQQIQASQQQMALLQSQFGKQSEDVNAFKAKLAADTTIASAATRCGNGAARLSSFVIFSLILCNSPVASFTATLISISTGIMNLNISIPAMTFVCNDVFIERNKKNKLV